MDSVRLRHVESNDRVNRPISPALREREEIFNLWDSELSWCEAQNATRAILKPHLLPLLASQL